ncbi:hypothetical protein J5N97_008436 [Dioscorea zingiberensis]|uniref:X8 domain-containing protein n=1 Tax=Dioscorea zingiberensis TaxID=325984 RepID=A0A9D5CUV9_9LILI|nr:hypothetical protein J5N97_008436 [Dioscorea zingiberensis]
MALLLQPLLLPILFFFIDTSDGAWCVCKTDLGDSALQKTLDYACGAGADCNPIIQNGPCYSPNSVKAHCNYAVNSYYQRKGQAQGSCDFSGTATTTSSDPSSNGCSYPASASTAAGTSTTPSTGNQGSTSIPGTGGTLTPSTGGTGGTRVIGGLGPSGSSVSPDYSEGGFVLQAGMSSLFLSIIILFLILGFD